MIPLRNADVAALFPQLRTKAQMTYQEVTSEIPTSQPIGDMLTAGFVQAERDQVPHAEMAIDRRVELSGRH
jgi:hypothetical protein